MKSDLIKLAKFKAIQELFGNLPSEILNYNFYIKIKKAIKKFDKADKTNKICKKEKKIIDNISMEKQFQITKVATIASVISNNKTFKIEYYGYGTYDRFAVYTKSTSKSINIKFSNKKLENIIELRSIDKLERSLTIKEFKEIVYLCNNLNLLNFI